MFAAFLPSKDSGTNTFHRILPQLADATQFHRANAGATPRDA